MSEPPADDQSRENLAAACGLFCPACTVYIGAREDPARLETLAARLKRPVEQLQCDGCRAERRSFYCRECKLAACAAERGLTFCGDCPEYPCDELKRFQAEMPHRIELWDSLAFISEFGFEAWFERMLKHYACEECGTINSAYDFSCRKCGHEPGNEYVRQHRAIMEKNFKAKLALMRC